MCRSRVVQFYFGVDKCACRSFQSKLRFDYVCGVHNCRLVPCDDSNSIAGEEGEEPDGGCSCVIFSDGNAADVWCLLGAGNNSFAARILRCRRPKYRFSGAGGCQLRKALAQDLQESIVTEF